MHRSASPVADVWYVTRALPLAFALIVTTHAAYASALDMHVVAGSGAIGIRDGSAQTASFMMPTQLAQDKSGNLYVVDTAAQRVRKIAPDGSVQTIAGGGPINASGMLVGGGYADGAWSEARFDHPDGIAVEANGGLVIADRDNACIRRLFAGRVTTLAGNPLRHGVADGPRDRAEFSSPRQLAIDKDGSIFVADWGAGLRRIAPDGSVGTLRPGGVTLDRPTGVAIGDSGPYSALFVADAKGLVRINPRTLSAERFPAFPDRIEAPGTLAGDVPFGMPFAISAFDSGDVVYTDLRDSSVKYVRLTNNQRYLGNTPAEDAMRTGGGPELGAYDAPMGVVVDPKRGTFVADTGNRRIVHIASFDRGRFVTSHDINALNFPKPAYRVALLGSSFTWWESGSDDSIAGFLSTRLAAVPALRERPPAFRYFQQSMSAEFDLIDSVLSAGAVDAVVLLISPIDPFGLGRGASPAAWGPYVRERVTRSTAALKAAHIPLLLVINPAANTLSPLESAEVFQSVQSDDATDYEREHAALAQVLAGIDVPLLDLYPAFRAQIARADHRPLFNTADTHYSQYGREFTAQAIFEKLQALHWWGGS